MRPRVPRRRCPSHRRLAALCQRGLRPHGQARLQRPQHGVRYPRQRPAHVLGRRGRRRTGYPGRLLQQVRGKGGLFVEEEAGRHVTSTQLAFTTRQSRGLIPPRLPAPPGMRPLRTRLRTYRPHARSHMPVAYSYPLQACRVSRRGDRPGTMGDALQPVPLGSGLRPVKVQCLRSATCALLAGGPRGNQVRELGRSASYMCSGRGDREGPCDGAPCTRAAFLLCPASWPCCAPALSHADFPASRAPTPCARSSAGAASTVCPRLRPWGTAWHRCRWALTWTAARWP